MAVSVSRKAWRACGRPNSSRPFSKSGVSGELRYFGELELVAVVVREDGLQVLPAIRRVAHAEAGGDFSGQPALFAIFDGLRRFLELVFVVLRGTRHDLDQRARLAGFFVLEAAAFAFRHLHAGPRGKIFHGIDETESLIFHDEADRRTVGAAAEAVVELLGRADREGRRFFVVEGAAGGVVGAGFLEGHVAIHQFDDVDPGQQILNE